MAIVSNWAKDLVVDEPDGIARYNVVQRSGAILNSEVYLRLASAILQQPTMLSAGMVNAFLDRDEATGKLYPKLKTREW